MEIKELVEKVRSEWEEIFIQEEENIRNIFLSNLDVSISMGISLEVINVEGTDYLAGKLNLSNFLILYSMHKSIICFVPK